MTDRRDAVIVPGFLRKTDDCNGNLTRAAGLPHNRSNDSSGQPGFARYNSVTVVVIAKVPNRHGF